MSNKIIDKVLTFYVNTHDLAAGVVDADSVPSYRLYEDESGTPILTGSMAKLDDANTVGFYSEQITLSAANGFEVGKSYCIRILATISGVDWVDTQYFDVVADTHASVLAVKAKTDNIPASPAAVSDCITAAGVRTAVGLGSANLDTQLSGINSKTTNLPGSPAAVGSAMTLTSGERNSIADAKIDRVDVYGTGNTERKLGKLLFATQGGKSSGGSSTGAATPKFRDVADTKNVVDSVVDENGNRTSVTLDLS